jgi:hypothetical protein
MTGKQQRRGHYPSLAVPTSRVHCELGATSGAGCGIDSDSPCPHEPFGGGMMRQDRRLTRLPVRRPSLAPARGGRFHALDSATVAWLVVRLAPPKRFIFEVARLDGPRDVMTASRHVPITAVVRPDVRQS